MGHYAKVINEIVIEVNVATQEWVDEQPNKWAWVQTSYNVRGGVYYDPLTNLPHEDQSLIELEPGRKRKNYAGIGFRYDIKRDAFIPPTPFPSWRLNEDTCLWEPPIPYPLDSIKMSGTKKYLWNEAKQEFTYTGYYYEDGELKKEEITEE
jgi:hypothetical protein